MDDNNNIILVDHPFDPNIPGNYDLLMKFTNNSFSYAVVDNDKGSVKVLFDKQGPVHFSNELDQTIANDQYLRINFRKVKISINTHKFTFIPEEFYSDFNLRSYAQFMNPLQQNDVRSLKIPSAGITNVASISSSHIAQLNEHFKAPSYYTQIEPFIEYAYRLKLDGSSRLFIDFGTKHFDVLVMKGDKLYLYNQYQFDNMDEFNYFILLIMQTFPFLGKDTSVMLSGVIDPQAKAIAIIEKYFSAPQYADVNNCIEKAALLNDMPAHYYVSLIGLNLCV